MPPRHAYWTILVDDHPTAFRAHDPEELLPTLNRLRAKNQTAVMKWFERGQLFESRDAAREAGYGRGERRWEGPRPDRDEQPVRKEDARGERRARDESARHTSERPRDKTWRPGGEHRDPRQKYRDAKKAKWSRFKEKIRARHERPPTERDGFRPAPQRGSPSFPEYSPPHGDPLRRRNRDERADREQPRFERPYDERRAKPTRPHGDKLRWRPPKDDRRSSERKPWSAKPRSGKPFASKPSTSRARNDKPRSSRPANTRTPFSSQEGKWRPKQGDPKRRRRDEEE